MKKIETLNEAMGVYFAWCEENGFVFMQPGSGTSGPVPGGWELVNCNGLICRVSDAGHVVKRIRVPSQRTATTPAYPTSSIDQK